jgi:hypothetical protein
MIILSLILIHFNLNFIAGRDFSSKNTLWGSRLTTTKRRELGKVVQANNYATLSAGSPN